MRTLTTNETSTVAGGPAIVIEPSANTAPAPEELEAAPGAETTTNG